MYLITMYIQPINNIYTLYKTLRKRLTSPAA